MYKTELEQFQGPLDLLLQLIEGHQMDVSQVSLAEVTDQYLAYLDTAANIDATELADFLVVATKLLIIKSRLLLPQLAAEEEDSAEALEMQLKFYKDYLDASKLIEGIIGQKKFCFSRERMAYNFQPTFSPPQNLGLDDLKNTFLEIIGRIDYIVNLPQRVMEKAVTLREKLSDIRSLLANNQKINFRSLIGDATSRMEMVVSFMAVLELLKKNEIAIHQRHVFDDITIEKNITHST